MSHERPSESDAPRARDRAVDRIIVIVAALVCFFFIASLRDVHLGMAVALAPTVPQSFGVRDAALDVDVVDEADKPISGASVRVFVVRDDRAYFAGQRATEQGRAHIDGLPRGDAWILAYDAGRARASTRVVLEGGPRQVRLVLRPASALDVVVVDPEDKPVQGAMVRVEAGDPLPYVATTGANGSARIDRLGPPPYVVRARAKGFDEAMRGGVTPGPLPLRIKLERLGGLEVTVIGVDGAPAPNATVLAAGSGLWPARSTVTDERGIARISGLPGGVYDLKARRGDDVSPTEIGVPLKRGEAKSIRLTLQHGRQVLVKVTDGPGDDAPGVGDASVVLVEEGLSSFPLQGKTNGKGTVVLGPIAPGRATASAIAKGFVPRSAVPLDEHATEVRVPLERGGAIVGDVKDDRGYPVDGAMIEVVGVDPEGMPIDESSDISDFREAHFDFALPGPRPLIPMGELGVMPGPIPDLPRDDSVVAAGSAPVARGEPWVTRIDGTFRAEPVPPGRVHVIVRHPSYVEAMTEPLTLKSGQELTVHIVLRQGGWIEGRVLEQDRSPVARARVELSATKGSLQRIAIAADDGTFSFSAVPDEVLLSVSRPSAPGDVVAQVSIDVPDRQRKDVEIVLPKMRDPLKLHVTDDRGYPLDRVEVRAISLDIAVPMRRTVFTNDDGDAELSDAVGVPLRLELLRPTKAPKIVELEHAPATMRVELSEGLRGRGVVTGRNGRDKLAGADVRIFTAAGARHARTDDEGTFIVEDLAPGRARITASHAEYAESQRVVEVKGNSLHDADLGTIDLVDAGQVEGVVVDPSDHPVAGARVARDAVPTYLPYGPLPPGIAVTDREGRFTLAGLPDGDAALEAYFSELGRGLVEHVTVRAGRTTTGVKIALAGGDPHKEPKGGGSVAVTLGERSEGGGKVVSILMVPPGSEAEIAGIEPGDDLLRVNGHDVRSIEDARTRLTGPLSEDVVVALARDEGGGHRATWLARVRRERVRR